MLLYTLVTFALLLALALSLSDCKGTENKSIQAAGGTGLHRWMYDTTCISFLFVFWLMTAFRALNIGNDTSAYVAYYKEIGKNGVSSDLGMEWGYQYYCLFLSKISLNPRLLLIVSATICYGLCGWYIFKYSNNVVFSTVLLFCIAFSPFTNTMRQSIAMVIVLFAYEMIKRNKKLIPILLIAVAALFHTSALIVLLWFGHKFVPKTPKKVLTCAVAIVVLAVSGVLNDVLALVLREYQNYFTSQYAGSGWTATTFYCMEAVAFYLIIYYAYSANGKDCSLVIANAVLFLILNCFGFSVNLFSRASSYFMLVFIAEIPNALNADRIKCRKALMAAIGGIMLMYFFVVLLFRPEWNKLYPYVFSLG